MASVLVGTGSAPRYRDALDPSERVNRLTFPIFLAAFPPLAPESCR